MKITKHKIGVMDYFTNPQYIGSTQLNSVKDHNSILNTAYKAQFNIEQEITDPMLKGHELNRLLQNKIALDFNVLQYVQQEVSAFTVKRNNEKRESQIIVERLIEFAYPAIKELLEDDTMYLAKDKNSKWEIEQPYGIKVDLNNQSTIFRARPDLMYIGKNDIVIYDFKCTSKNDPIQYRTQSELYHSVLSIWYPKHFITTKYILFPSTKDISYINTYVFPQPEDVCQFLLDCIKLANMYNRITKNPAHYAKKILIKQN